MRYNSQQHPDHKYPVSSLQPHDCSCSWVHLYQQIHKLSTVNWSKKGANLLKRWLTTLPHLVQWNRIRVIARSNGEVTATNCKTGYKSKRTSELATFHTNLIPAGHDLCWLIKYIHTETQRPSSYECNELVLVRTWPGWPIVITNSSEHIVAGQQERRTRWSTLTSSSGECCSYDRTSSCDSLSLAGEDERNICGRSSYRSYISVQACAEMVQWYHHADEEPDEVSTPFECCSRWEFVHPPTVYQRISVAVDQEGYLLCPESLPWHSQLNLMVQPLMWWFSQWAFSQKSAFCCWIN